MLSRKPPHIWLRILSSPFLHSFKSNPALSLWVQIGFYQREIKQIVQAFQKKILTTKIKQSFATLILLPVPDQILESIKRLDLLHTTHVFQRQASISMDLIWTIEIPKEPVAEDNQNISFFMVIYQCCTCLIHRISIIQH